jgi:hypothetical protein
MAVGYWGCRYISQLMRDKRTMVGRLQGACSKSRGVEILDENVQYSLSSKVLSTAFRV